MATKVGFIGLGVLGSAMAANLIKCGFDVVGYDVAPEKIAALAEDGMETATSPRDVAARTEMVVTCLPTPEAMMDVFAGHEGIDKAMGEGQIIIESSTFSIADKERARDAVAAAGKITLDCPVSGNRILAVKKQLTCFGSGDETAYRAVEDVIEGYANRIFYVGATS